VVRGERQGGNIREGGKRCKGYGRRLTQLHLEDLQKIEGLWEIDRRERERGRRRGVTDREGETRDTLKHWIEDNKQNEITDVSGGSQAADKEVDDNYYRCPVRVCTFAYIYISYIGDHFRTEIRPTMVDTFAYIFHTINVTSILGQR